MNFEGVNRVPSVGHASKVEDENLNSEDVKTHSVAKSIFVGVGLVFLNLATGFTVNLLLLRKRSWLKTAYKNTFGRAIDALIKSVKKSQLETEKAKTKKKYQDLNLTSEILNEISKCEDRENLELLKIKAEILNLKKELMDYIKESQYSVPVKKPSFSSQNISEDIREKCERLKKLKSDVVEKDESGVRGFSALWKELELYKLQYPTELKRETTVEEFKLSCLLHKQFTGQDFFLYRECTATWKPIYYAVTQGNVEVLEYMLECVENAYGKKEAKIYADIGSVYGTTLIYALTSAPLDDLDEIIRVLIQYDVNLTNQIGQGFNVRSGFSISGDDTPLKVALKRYGLIEKNEDKQKFKEVLARLVSKGAYEESNSNLYTEDEKTTIQQISSNSH